MLLEEALYLSAATLQQYSDLSTLQQRVVAVADTLSANGLQLRVPGRSTSSTSTGSMGHVPAGASSGMGQL